MALTISCGARRPGQFESLPGKPFYRLRSPARIETPYPEVLAAHGDVKEGWVDLTGGMTIQIEKAVFADPQGPRNLSNFVGLESARFAVTDTGRLKNMAIQELPNRPAHEEPIRELVGTRFQRQRYHRLYFQIVFDRRSGDAPAVVLGADTREALRQLGDKLTANARAVCGQGSVHCIVIPPNTTTSLQFEIFVNGKPSFVSWGTSVKGVVGTRTSFEMQRKFGGRSVPVRIDAQDPEALRLPILPGDRFDW